MQISAATLRSLAAIHLATVRKHLRQLGVLIGHDQRMISEAEALALPVLSPT
jgi:hypothetical protein